MAPERRELHGEIFELDAPQGARKSDAMNEAIFGFGALILLLAVWFHPWDSGPAPVPVQDATDEASLDRSGHGDRESRSLPLLTGSGVRAPGAHPRLQSWDSSSSERTPLSAFLLSVEGADELGTIETVATGGRQHLALTTDGSVWSWGSITPCHPLSSEERFAARPTKVDMLPPVMALSAGPCHVLALARDGAVWAWGRNDRGQLGDGTMSDRWEPVRVAGLAGVTGVSAGEDHSLAVTADGSAWAWGDGRSAELGADGLNMATRAVRVFGIDDAVAVAAGSDRSFALLASGHVWSWGISDVEGTSAGRTTVQLQPAAVSGIDHVRAIVAGARYALALREDGSVWAWGDNFRGQVAAGVMKPAVSTPTRVQGLSRITVLSADEFHALALREDGTVWTWGMGGPWLDEYEITGSQGDGALRRLPSLFRVKAIAAGMFVDFAVEADR